MSADYPDGTILVATPFLSMYDVYVKDSTSGWGDLVWYQAGVDIPSTQPEDAHELFVPEGPLTAHEHLGKQYDAFCGWCSRWANDDE